MNQVILRIVIFIGIVFFLAACTAETTLPTVTAPAEPTPVVLPTETAAASTETTTPPAPLPDLGISCALFDGLVTVQCQQIAAYTPDVAHQTEKVVTAHLQLTLSDHTLAQSAVAPVIGIYPIAKFAQSSDAPLYIKQLRLLLTERPDELNGRLPTFAFGQGTPIHANPAYLDIKGSTGVRFVGQLSNGQSFEPITNETLFYGFQGVTNDNAYYLAAILPISHTTLPMAGADVSNYDEMLANSEQYLTETENSLTLDAAGYTPTLTELDLLLQQVLQNLPITAGQQPLAISLAGFEPLDVNAPLNPDQIEPAATYAYWAIHHYDLDKTDEIVASFGDKSELSTAVQAQLESLLSPDCLSGEVIPNSCFTYILTVLEDGTVERWQQAEEVAAFLGDIDTYQEAMLLALSQDFGFGPPGATGSYKAVADGFELIGLKLVSDCDPIQTDRVRILVTHKGAITILQSEVFSTSDGCI